MKKYPKQPLYMFHDQGYDGIRALHTTVEDIATRYLKEMRTVQPIGPYYLAGFSFGGMVVYEMAQQLHKQGETIGLLALLDPTIKFSEPPSRKIRLNHWLSTTRLLINERLTNLNTISVSIFTKAWAILQGRLKKMICNVYFGFGYLLPTFLRPFYQQIIVGQAVRQYIPQNYPGQIVIFQTNISTEQYWSNLCGKVVKVYDLPCAHNDIPMNGPLAPKLLHQLMDCLEKAQKKTLLKQG